MTERLFETDSHLKLFYAKVLLCEKTEKTDKDKKGYKIVLDKTAFFPKAEDKRVIQDILLQAKKMKTIFSFLVRK